MKTLQSIAKPLVLRRKFLVYRPTQEQKIRMMQTAQKYWRQRYPLGADHRDEYMLHIDEGYILDAMVEPRAAPARSVVSARRRQDKNNSPWLTFNGHHLVRDIFASPGVLPTLLRIGGPRVLISATDWDIVASWHSDGLKLPTPDSPAEWELYNYLIQLTSS